MAIKRTCSCGKDFVTDNDSLDCRDCCLKAIVGNGAPEEGDFNTALIQSGTMTAKERQWLQQDLESVEVQDPDDGYYDEQDDLFDDYEDEDIPFDIDVEIEVTCECGFWSKGNYQYPSDYPVVEQSEKSELMEEFQKEHLKIRSNCTRELKEN